IFGDKWATSPGVGGGIYMEVTSEDKFHNGGMLTQGYDHLRNVLFSHYTGDPLNIKVGNYRSYRFLIDATMNDASNTNPINHGEVLIARIYLYCPEGVKCVMPAHPEEEGEVHYIEMEWLFGGEYYMLWKPPGAVFDEYDTLLLSTYLDPLLIEKGERKMVEINIDDDLRSLEEHGRRITSPFIGDWYIYPISSVDDCYILGTAVWLEVWFGTGKATYHYADLIAEKI
ncbi:MAG: hypothetical protein ACTSXC_05595, partial [Candidatus Freyarchaeota archaeon]